MIDLIAIQEEQIAWSERNFGQQPARLPHLGIIEELGELGSAYELDDIDQVRDAVGDVGIYALDFCGKMKWNLADFWNDRVWFDNESGDNTARRRIFTLVRRLAHHQLKGEQGIRGGAAHHEEQMRHTLRALMFMLDRICDSYLDDDFLNIIEAVWAKVRLRDWTKNKDNAHEVVAQQVIDGAAMARSNDP